MVPIKGIEASISCLLDFIQRERAVVIGVPLLQEGVGAGRRLLGLGLRDQGRERGNCQGEGAQKQSRIHGNLRVAWVLRSVHAAAWPIGMQGLNDCGRLAPRPPARQYTWRTRLMMRSWQIAVMILIGSMGIASAQDVAAGEESFRKCLPCHSIGPDAKNKVGPEQNGLDGRKAGTVSGFSYTEANKNSGIVWNEDTFKSYIA